MKFWPNMDSSKISEMIPKQYFNEASGQGGKVTTSENYVFRIVQQVCRGGKPFNNAKVAFVTTNYTVNVKTFQYSVEGSEINVE